jgi:UDP-N-acetylglucosamine 2-epimerase
MPKKILHIVGTRPEIIKVAPVVQALKSCLWAAPRLITTGQHRELLEQHLKIFGLTPDGDLKVMRPGQSLSKLTSHLADGLEDLLTAEKPDLVLAQGDTSTVMVTAMICFYLGLPFAHLEAGLRSGDMRNPFPEEYNRKVAALSTALHLAPTEGAKRALLAEGVPGASICVTGNTVIDSLYYMREQLGSMPACPYPVDRQAKLLLLTAHRRENFGQPLAGIFEVLGELVAGRPDIELLYPVHPNPQVSAMAREILGERERVHLSAPLDYQDFIGVLNNTHIVLSDSGGVQEEAPALGKPVLVLRQVTERRELIEAGAAKLVGTDPEIIKSAILALLDDPTEYAAMSQGISPYGDGRASLRVVDALAAFLGVVEQRQLSDFQPKEPLKIAASSKH